MRMATRDSPLPSGACAVAHDCSRDSSAPLQDGEMRAIGARSGWGARIEKPPGAQLLLALILPIHPRRNPKDADSHRSKT
jgi:hypothetical protein